MYGAILGSALVTWVQNFLLDMNRAFPGVTIFRYPMLFVGSIYILLVIFMPAGMMGGIYQAIAWFKRRRNGSSVSGTAVRR